MTARKAKASKKKTTRATTKNTTKKKPSSLESKWEAEAKKLKQDPVFKLKPYDVVSYTPIAVDGERLDTEIHVILPTSYKRSPDAITFWDTLRIVDDQCYADRLHCMGKDVCEVEVLTDKLEVQQSFLRGKLTCKLKRKRKPRAAK